MAALSQEYVETSGPYEEHEDILQCLTLPSSDQAMARLHREAWKKWKVRHEADNIKGSNTDTTSGNNS